ncbi:hypothetical protein EVAR_73903_1 [Eumeta japonica]|uniref:Uncharacterized protein n=1 Tax=Eumeta variegata TaxID=151549 RepID=A0A4C1TA40_EUMVA|nr:hypothetical protein EVAR_73903_1 [Eumeta japonica]
MRQTILQAEQIHLLLATFIDKILQALHQEADMSTQPLSDVLSLFRSTTGAATTCDCKSGVGLSNAMAVQPGASVSGPTATGNQASITATTTKSADNKGKLRTHALKIIHPITNKNILDDLDIDKNDLPDISAVPSTTPLSSKSTPTVDLPLDIEIGSSSTSSSTPVKSDVKIPEASKVHTDIIQNTETSTHQTGANTAERNFKEVLD